MFRMLLKRPASIPSLALLFAYPGHRINLQIQFPSIYGSPWPCPSEGLGQRFIFLSILCLFYLPCCNRICMVMLRLNMHASSRAPVCPPLFSAVVFACATLAAVEAQRNAHAQSIPGGLTFEFCAITHTCHTLSLPLSVFFTSHFGDNPASIKVEIVQYRHVHAHLTPGCRH